jgi:hypothetical protein
LRKKSSYAPTDFGGQRSDDEESKSEWGAMDESWGEVCKEVMKSMIFEGIRLRGIRRVWMLSSIFRGRRNGWGRSVVAWASLHQDGFVRW